MTNKPTKKIPTYVDWTEILKNDKDELEKSERTPSHYDKAFIANSKDIESSEKVCLLCLDLVVVQGQDKKVYGKRVVPMLEILRVELGDKDTIMVYWICPSCKMQRLIDKFSSFKQAVKVLDVLKNANKLSKQSKLVLQLMNDGKYESLPGYTESIQRNIAIRKLKGKGNRS